jgi:hypothetical protein
MRKGGRDIKEDKEVKRKRSDLTVDEFGANTRNNDGSLSGHALSPHWNRQEEVVITSNIFW